MRLKSGMIIRRATLVVAGRSSYDAMPRSATPWLPRTLPEGSREAGIEQRRGCQDRAKNLLGHLHPATASHLPLEDTALPFAVAPFASSPFAHPIPLSRRRASGDLFSGSLKKKPGAGSLPPGYRHPLHRGVIGLLPSHHPTRFSCLSNWTKVQPVRKSFTTDLAVAPSSAPDSLPRVYPFNHTHPYSRRFPGCAPVGAAASASTPAITSNNSSSILLWRWR